MTPNPLRRDKLIESIRSDRGQTLVLALVLLLVLSISAATAAQLISSHASASNAERQGAQAFSGGEAGLDLAANWVKSTDTAGTMGVGSVHTGTSTAAGNSISWTATKGATSQWTLKSSTVSPNGRITRSLQEEMQATVSVGVPATIWGYGFVMGGTAPASVTPEAIACGQGSNPLPPTTTFLGGSSSINVPMWVDGDVCEKSGGDPAIGNPTGCVNTVPPPGTSGTPPACAISVHIGGTLYSENVKCDIGSGGQAACASPSPNYVKSAFVKVCVNGGTVPCDQAGSGVYASSFTAPEPTPTPQKPVLDAATEKGFWQTASPGPNNFCGAGSTGTTPPNLFDNNAPGSSPAGSTTVPDTSLGSVNFLTLLGNTAFDCKTSAPGELKWTPGTGVLLVKGTIFIDASLYLNKNSNTIRWDPASDGSIYTNGTFSLSNNASLCATVACSPGSDSWPASPPAGPFVFLSAYNNGSLTTDGFTLSQNAIFEGDGYTNGGFNMDTTSTMAGTIFADYGNLTANGFFAVAGTPPNGSLGSKTTFVAWSVAPRTWRQCPISSSGCT